MEAVEIHADNGELRIRRPEEVHGGGKDEECGNDADAAVPPARVAEAATGAEGEGEWRYDDDVLWWLGKEWLADRRRAGCLRRLHCVYIFINLCEGV